MEITKKETLEAQTHKYIAWELKALKQQLNRKHKNGNSKYKGETKKGNMKQANTGNENGYTKLGTLNMQVLKMVWERDCGVKKKN